MGDGVAGIPRPASTTRVAAAVPGGEGESDGADSAGGGAVSRVDAAPPGTAVGGVAVCGPRSPEHRVCGRAEEGGDAGGAEDGGAGGGAEGEEEFLQSLRKVLCLAQLLPPSLQEAPYQVQAAQLRQLWSGVRDWRPIKGALEVMYTSGTSEQLNPIKYGLVPIWSGFNMEWF